MFLRKVLNPGLELLHGGERLLAGRSIVFQMLVEATLDRNQGLNLPFVVVSDQRLRRRNRDVNW